MARNGIAKARQLFRDVGLAFPTIPAEFAVVLKELAPWLFSTQPVYIPPYNLKEYINEAQGMDVRDHALLSHSGHGVNSYAIQYYLVRNPLRMFLHLGWGGLYMDTDVATVRIRECFSIADQLVLAAQESGRFRVGECLTLVGSDFYGSYWLAPGDTRPEEAHGSAGPSVILTRSLGWLIG